jgi:hypothetical protein
MKETTMEDIIADLATMYDVLGFNHLLGALDTMLVRKWDAHQRDPLMTEGLGDLTREIARLKKARVPLSDTERAEITTHGILWSPPTHTA